MRDVFGTMVAVGALLAASGHALAQDPCATLAAQGASLAGFAGAKVEPVKSGNNTICEMRTGDRRSTLRLVVEPPQAAGGLAMRRTLAMNSKEPGMKTKDESALGANAFSFSTAQQVSFSAAGKGGVYTLSLTRDAIAAGDEERLRAIGKQLVEGR